MGGHSRRPSETSNFSFVGPDQNGTSGVSRDSVYSPPTRTPAGLSNEDSRSFFAKRKGHRKSFSFEAPPLPSMPGLPESGVMPAENSAMPRSTSTREMESQNSGHDQQHLSSAQSIQQQQQQQSREHTRVVCECQPTTRARSTAQLAFRVTSRFTLTLILFAAVNHLPTYRRQRRASCRVARKARTRCRFGQI